MKTLNSQCRYILRIDHLNGQIERFQNSNFHSEVFLQLLTNTNMVLFPLLNIYLLIEKASGERGRRKRNISLSTFSGSVNNTLGFEDEKTNKKI